MKNNFFNKIIKNNYFGIGAIVVAIVAAMIILFTNSSDESLITKNVFNEFEYSNVIEEKINDIVSKIDGAGRSYCMISLKNSYEKIYAKEYEESVQIDGSNKVFTSEEYTDKIVVLESDENENALEITEISPKIAGVVIVCEGGDNERIKGLISNAVSTLLGISDEKVCILKSK